MTNRKISILGKKIPLMLVMGLLLVGAASAVVVSYLSNTATMNVGVESPATVQFAEVAHGVLPVNSINKVAAPTVVWTDILAPSSTTGLSTLELGLKIENNADVAIAGKTLEVNVINELLNVDCADITSLTFIDVGCSPSNVACYQVIQELATIPGICVDNGAEITYSIPINSLGAGDVFKYPVTVTFGVVAPTNYTFDATMIV